MSIVEKIWGTTEPLVMTPLFEMHRLVIKSGFRCSLHVHQSKWNAFYIIDGTLIVDLAAEGNVLEQRLVAGKYLTIAPGLAHQFRTGQTMGCEALEMYYTEPLHEDIRRFCVGGPA